jgi:hypothetical protein
MRHAVLLASVGIAALWLSVLGGCVTAPSALDESFGTSVLHAKNEQILNPDATTRREPVDEFDGEAAMATIDRYRRQFEIDIKAPEQVGEFVEQ